MILGNQHSGKSAVMRRANGAPDNEYRNTIGIDFISIACKYEHANSSQEVKFQLWDTAGQERYQTITESYVRGAHFLIYCVNLDQSNGALSSEIYAQIAKLQRAAISLPTFIIGTNASRAQDANQEIIKRYVEDDDSFLIGGSIVDEIGNSVVKCFGSYIDGYSQANLDSSINAANILSPTLDCFYYQIFQEEKAFHARVPSWVNTSRQFHMFGRGVSTALDVSSAQTSGSALTLSIQRLTDEQYNQLTAPLDAQITVYQEKSWLTQEHVRKLLLLNNTKLVLDLVRDTNNGTQPLEINDWNTLANYIVSRSKTLAIGPGQKNRKVLDGTTGSILTELQANLNKLLLPQAKSIRKITY